MTPDLRAAIDAFHRVERLRAAAALTFADKVRIVAAALDYEPIEALTAALIAEEEIRG